MLESSSIGYGEMTPKEVLSIGSGNRDADRIELTLGELGALFLALLWCKTCYNPLLLIIPSVILYFSCFVSAQHPPPRAGMPPAH